MSNSPVDDERLDTDPTDELPILLETAVIDPEENRVAVGDDPTGEHTAYYPSLKPQDGADIDALKSDLEQRSAKIVTLEHDISRLSARWIDIERHLTSKDTLIDELKATLASLRSTLDLRHSSEQRLSKELADRSSQLERAIAQIEQLEGSAAVRDASLTQSERDRHTALDELARLTRELSDHTTANSRDPANLQSLREEVAALSSYIANRRTWWDELEARAAAQIVRIAELEREVTHRTERQQRGDSLAQRESARAEMLREQLVQEKLRADALDAQLTARGDPLAARATLSALEVQLADAKATITATQTELALSQSAATELRAQLAETRHIVAEHVAAQERRDHDHATALAAADALRVTELAAASERAAAAAATPPLALETIAQLERERELARTELSAERTTAREQEQRIVALTVELDSTLRQLAELRAQLEDVRGDAARIERAVIDKDRALDARDERIATLQRELDQKLGALQKLNAMDKSLQGLDSKMSERLRRTDASPVDQPNTPALVCLTSDVPRQYALAKKTMTIGRSSRCDIQILTHFVSREHARLTIARGVVIEDLGSTNGIFVNSNRVDRQELHHGDLVTVGETQFRFLESMAH